MEKGLAPKVEALYQAIMALFVEGADLNTLTVAEIARKAAPSSASRRGIPIISGRNIACTAETAMKTARLRRFGKRKQGDSQCFQRFRLRSLKNAAPNKSAA